MVLGKELCYRVVGLVKHPAGLLQGEALPAPERLGGDFQPGLHTAVRKQSSPQHQISHLNDFLNPWNYQLRQG
jgi:hypothetical protein